MRTKKLFKISAALCAIGFLFFLRHNSINQCTNSISPSYSQKINFNNKQALLDTSVVKLNNNFYYILAYMTDGKSSYPFTGVSFFPINENGNLSSTPLEFGETQHIRSFSKIITPWGEGVLMADHGIDGGEFPGGKLLLVVEDKITGKLSDKSSELKQQKNFAFNAIAVRRTNEKYDDILVAPFNGPRSKVVYLKATESGYVDASDILPEVWSHFERCFMTAVPFDTNLDGKDEIALGSCDLNLSQHPLKNDQLLEWDNDHWNFSKGDTFPARKLDPTWGTVYWLKDQRNLMALTHNKGFTKGAIQSFSYDQKNKKFKENSVELKNSERDEHPHYFHKIQKFKDIFYTLIRYGGGNFDKPNLLAIKSSPDGIWRETRVCLATPPKEVILGIDAFENREGKPLFFLTYYSGRMDVFE
jgi:hypothetical protein